MSIPFSQTMRSMHADNHYFSIWSLIGAIVLAWAWGVWFFNAELTFYENSKTMEVTEFESLEFRFPRKHYGTVQRVQKIRQRVLTAKFSSQALDQIKTGQMAYVRLDNRNDIIYAVVTTVGHGKVQLLAEIPAMDKNPFKTGGHGEVRIEIEHITPAALVMRTAGL